VDAIAEGVNSCLGFTAIFCYKPEFQVIRERMLNLALAATAAAIAAGYQTMSATGSWYGRAFHGLPRGSRKIALTFDDGPNDPYTQKVLDVLSKHNVHASFFLIGRYVQQRPDIVRLIAEQGHVVGNHTFTHPLLTFESKKHVRDEIVHCREVITGAVGPHSNLFRPPWGGRRPGVFPLVRQLGLEPIMWNVMGYDWKAPSAEYIVKKVARGIRGGDVILLHDGGHLVFGTDRAATVRATDVVISRYKAEGYEFVTIPEMMKEPGSRFA
jgi:peptidoglycan-N-acetylglucosamine deacetylase